MAALIEIGVVALKVALSLNNLNMKILARDTISKSNL